LVNIIIIDKKKDRVRNGAILFRGYFLLKSKDDLMQRAPDI
jgi:hypothetical protein